MVHTPSSNIQDSSAFALPAECAESRAQSAFPRRALLMLTWPEQVAAFLWSQDNGSVAWWGKNARMKKRGDNKQLLFYSPLPCLSIITRGKEKSSQQLYSRWGHASTLLFCRQRLPAISFGWGRHWCILFIGYSPTLSC